MNQADVLKVLLTNIATRPPNVESLNELANWFTENVKPTERMDQDAPKLFCSWWTGEGLSKRFSEAKIYRGRWSGDEIIYFLCNKLKRNPSAY